MSDLHNRATLVINADATGANKVINDLKNKTIPSLKDPIKKVGRETGDAFGREFNQQTNKWARLLGQTFGRYFGEWGRQVQEIFYMAKDIREILPSGRKEMGGGKRGGGVSVSDVGTIAAADVTGDVYRQRTLQNTVKSTLDERFGYNTFGINGLPDPNTRTVDRAGAAARRMQLASGVGTAAGGVGAVGAGAAGTGLLASTGIGLGIAVVVVGLGTLVSKLVEWKDNIKDVSKQLNVSSGFAKKFVGYWDGINEDGLQFVKTLSDLLKKAKEGDISARDQLRSQGINARGGVEQAYDAFVKNINNEKSGTELDRKARRFGMNISELDKLRGDTTDTTETQNKRQSLADDLNLQDDSKQATKDKLEAMWKSTLKDEELAKVTAAELKELQNKLAVEKQKTIQDKLILQIGEKTIQLDKLQNSIKEKKLKADEEKKAAADQDRQDLANAIGDKVKTTVGDITEKNPGLYDTTKLSPEQILQQESDRLRHSTMSPAELALETAKKGAVLGTKSVKDRLKLAQDMGAIGSFKKRIPKSSEFNKNQEAQKQAAAIQQLLNDYVQYGAVPIKPKNGK